MENSKIEWCTHTFNPWYNCTKVSPACDNCYAEAMMDKRLGRVKWGAGQPRVRTSEANWRAPIKWATTAGKAGRTTDTVFCASLADVWDNEVDPKWREDLFDLIENTRNFTWLLLSKRIGNAVDMAVEAGGLPPNCALGASMANQDEYDRDIGKLFAAGITLGAKFTFVSIEPLLGPISHMDTFPDWVIVGGESGKHARPMNLDWARSVRDQCERARVPFLFKQWGEWAPTNRLGEHMSMVGKKKAGRTLDGIIHDGFPACISGLTPRNIARNV